MLLNQRTKEAEAGKDLIRALGEKLEAAGAETAALETEVSNFSKELEITKEELRQARRRVETLRQENGEMEVELKRQIRLVEDGQERADELGARLDELSKERLSLQTRLAGAKSENEILRRENERILISQKDVADEVARFGQLGSSIKQEMIKKKGLAEHKAEAERELRRAVE